MGDFLDFVGGMRPRTSIAIEEFCGRAELAFPEDVPDEINGYNMEDHFGDVLDIGRFHMPFNNHGMYSIGFGSYRSNNFAIFY